MTAFHHISIRPGLLHVIPADVIVVLPEKDAPFRDLAGLAVQIEQGFFSPENISVRLEDHIPYRLDHSCFFIVSGLVGLQHLTGPCDHHIPFSHIQPFIPIVAHLVRCDLPFGISIPHEPVSERTVRSPCAVGSQRQEKNSQ